MFHSSCFLSVCVLSSSGGLAKPATLECNVGPGDYYVDGNFPGDIGTSNNGTIRSGFGTSSRFIKSGLQYISSEHAKGNVGQAGPGPKYSSAIGTIGATAKTPRNISGLKWI